MHRRNDRVRWCIVGFIVSSSFIITSNLLEAKTMKRCIGKSGAKVSFIYLHGLDPSYGSAEEWTNRKIWEELAEKYPVRVVLPRSPNRCKSKKCWVYGTQRTMDASIQILKDEAKRCGVDYSKSWIVGFSNGGYFLNRIFQKCLLKGNHISVAAPSSVISGGSLKNCGALHVIAGRKEISFQGAKSLARKLKSRRQANTTFHSHSLYHHLPHFPEFEKILKRLKAISNRAAH